MAWSGYLLDDLLVGGGLELIGGHVAKGTVEAGAGEPGDVFHGRPAGGGSGGPGLLVEALAFQGGEERLGEGVVPALPGAAARQDDGQVVGEGGVGAAGVLTAAVGMEHHPGCGVAGGDGVGQRVGDQLGAQVLGQANPTTRREAMSITVARYSQPSQVGI